MQLMQRGLKNVFPDPKGGPQQILTVLYQIAVSTDEAAESDAGADGGSGRRRRRSWHEFVPTFFTAANKPATATDAQWNEARTTMEKVVRRTRRCTSRPSRAPTP